MNESKFSLTQSGNLTALVGLIVMLLKLFNVNIAETEIQSFIGAFVVIVGIIISWVGRWRAGGLYLSGFRRKE